MADAAALSLPLRRAAGQPCRRSLARGAERAHRSLRGIGQPSLTTLATRIVILGIGAASLIPAARLRGLVSFGHAAFYGVSGT
jgi:ABC-type branched-subunit amino acid transport system permease subunit